MFDFEWEHVCSYAVTLDPEVELIGPVAEGIRVNGYVTGGEVTGPRINGVFRPTGGDWLTVRTDGVVILDVRATIETHDGALIYLRYSGVGDFGAEGYQQFLDGTQSSVLPLRTAPMMQSAHPDYLWVNRLQFISIGEVDFATSRVAYDVYALK